MAFWNIQHILNKIFDSATSALNIKVTSALPAGDNNIGNVDLASAIPAGTNNIGDVDVLSIAAGDNNIGNVDLASAIPAGTNNIGDVDVLSIAAGTNEIGVIRHKTGGNVIADATALSASKFIDSASNVIHLPTFNMRYNTDTYDMERGNTAQTALASAQRTATTNSSDLTLYNEPGADFIINISSINAGTPSITVLIQVKDNISSNYVTVLTSAALNSVATTRLRVYPGITASANVAVSDILRRTIRVSVTHADAQAIDYSISMGPIAA